jgi:hypothetical protein
VARVMLRDGIDVEPQVATCDVCHHRHACYVGGRAPGTDAGPSSWEIHACLGCLMRAGPWGALEAGNACRVASAGVLDASPARA